VEVDRGHQDPCGHSLDLLNVQRHSVRRLRRCARNNIKIVAVALLLALALSVAPSGGAASASPVSQTDCSSSYLTKWPSHIGKSWYSWGMATTNNFSPGQSGYSPETGWVTCDTRTHSVVLFWAFTPWSPYHFAASDVGWNGNGSMASYYVSCGTNWSGCAYFRSDHYEQFVWFDTRYQ